MKTMIAAGLMALSVGTVAATSVRAQDFGERVVRGIAREATGDYGRDYRGDRDYRRDREYRREGRAGYGDGCHTVTIRRETPDGSVTKRIRRCD
jgi:hypothetical protein